MGNLSNNNFIQSALDSLSAHIVILDEDGYIRYVNQAWKDFAVENGLSLEYCCEGVNYLEIIKGDNEDTEVYNGIKAVINDEKEIFEIEYPCHSPFEKRWFNMRVTPFKGEGDYKVVISHENITKRELSRIKLEQEREFYDNILNNLSEMIIYLDSDFNIQWANQAALDYGDIKLKNLMGNKCYNKWGINEACENCPLVKSKNIGEIQNEIMEKPDGRIWRMKAIPDTNDQCEIQGFIEVALDITKEKIAERKIKQVVSKLEEQFEKAGKLHDQFLPTRTPKFEDFTIATYYSPAERLGGDFYNFIELEDHLVFYISDVSGHDLSGSMLNIFLKETINSYLIGSNIKENSIKDILNPARILKYINQRYSEETFPDDYFICLILGVMDLNTHEIIFSNAGVHFSPLLFNEEGVSSFTCSGMPINFIGYNQHDVCKLTLNPGDSFFLSTDGLIEQQKGKEMYTAERLIKLLSNNSNKAPDQVIETIYHDFNNFKGDTPVQDDVTYLILKHDKGGGKK